MSFLDRVREKLLEPNRIRRVERFQGNDAQKVFAGMEILAEDLAVFGEKLDKLEHRMDTFVIEMSAPVEMHLTDKAGTVYDIKDEQIPFSEPPLDEHGDGSEECPFTRQFIDKCYKRFVLAPDGSIREPFTEEMEKTKASSPASGNESPEPDIGRVNKLCKCGVMMLNVHPATKYCDKCKGAK